MKVVALAPPNGKDEIVRMLDDLWKRAADGEFESMIVVGIRPDGRWMSKEAGGHKVHPLMVVGALESLKQDLLDSRKDASE